MAWGKGHGPAEVGTTEALCAAVVGAVDGSTRDDEFMHVIAMESILAGIT
jgi:hypothetical protein